MSRKGDTLHAVVPAFFEHARFVVTFRDAGGVGIQTLDTHEDDPVLVTYPISRDCLTDRSVFNLGSFPVRAVRMGGSKVPLPIYVDGKYTGLMNFKQNLRRNVDFYDFPISVGPGNHSLTVGRQSLVFFVGNVSEAVVEPAALYIVADIPLLGTSWMIFELAMHIVPWWYLCAPQLERYRQYVWGGDVTMGWWDTIAWGILYYWGRTQMTTWPVFIANFLSSTIFILVPMLFVLVQDHIALVWWWGVYLNGSLKHYAMTGVLLIVYTFFHGTPILAACGFLAEAAQMEWNCLMKTELVLFCFPTLVSVIGGGLLMILAGDWQTLFTAPFMWVQVVNSAFLIYYYYPSASKKKAVEESGRDPGGDEVLTEAQVGWAEREQL
jgi:hypothetical protein